MDSFMLDLFSHHIDHQSTCSDPQDFYPQLFQPYSQNNLSKPDWIALPTFATRSQQLTVSFWFLIKQPFWLLSSIGALKGAGLF